LNSIHTRLVKIEDIQKDAPEILLAAETLRRGGLVALPTETVYGIAADALNPEAVAKIFEAKGRPPDNPLIVHIAGWEQLEPLVSAIPPGTEALARAFWPGPLTMVLPKSPRVPYVVSGGLETVAVRMPSHPCAREIIARSGLPVAAPSANLSGRPSPTTASHCMTDLDGKVELIVDGGACAVGVESTVVTLADSPPRLLRPGAVTLSQLRWVLGEVEVDPAVSREAEAGAVVSSPGMKYKHYAPKAQVVLVNGPVERLCRLLEREAAPGVFGLVFDEDLGRMPVPSISYGPEGDSAAQARNLFAALRELDDRGARRVYARAPLQDGVGMAVYNRLIRAAGFTEITV